MKVLVGLLLVGLSIGAFFLGKAWSLRHCIHYTFDGTQLCCSREWPVYGLPLAEYESLLSLLRSEKHDQAVARLDALLDGAMLEAMQRRRVLSEEGRARLDNSIKLVAQYRDRYPRSNTNPVGAGVYLTKDKLDQIDAFLKSELERANQGARDADKK